MLTVVPEENGSNKHTPAGVGGSLLDELVRDGARQMLAAALQAEVAAYVEAHADQFDADGHRLVVRNGYHAAREVAVTGHTSLSHVDGRISMRGPRDVTPHRRGWSAMSVWAVAARDSTRGAAGQQ